MAERRWWSVREWKVGEKKKRREELKDEQLPVDDDDGVQGVG